MIKNKSRPIVLLLLAMLWASMTHAQESINASGGNATGSGGSVAYSVGIVVYTTETGSSGSMAQGVQHTFPGSKPIKGNRIEGVQVQTSEEILASALSAYPNPASEKVTLQLQGHEKEILSYQLFDVEGKLLEKGFVEGQETDILLAKLPAASYKLQVLNQNNQSIKTFQIIKK